MCLRRGALVAIFTVVLGSVSLTAASANHCTGDKDHLGNGSCGYVVEPILPTPSPGPWPVTVENVPTVEVRPEPGASPIPVEITNPPETDPSSGWNSSDRAILASLSETVQRSRLMLVWVGGLVLFALGLVVVFVIPRGR